MIQNLLKYFKIVPLKFSIETVVVILQRITGCLLLFTIVSTTELYDLATQNRYSFNQLSPFFIKDVIVFSSLLCYVMTSIREEILDSGIIQNPSNIYRSAIILCVFSSLVSFGVGYWVW